jgi:hypothetical protein
VTAVTVLQDNGLFSGFSNPWKNLCQPTNMTLNLLEALSKALPMI